MRAVDTNVVVRLLVRDEPDQMSAAERFIAGGVWVSHLVLAETAWVLDAVYERSVEQIATAMEMLLNHRDLTLQDADVVEIARKAGHVPLGTFDRDLSRLESVERLR